MQIRSLVLQGFSYKDIQLSLEISEGTWDSWMYRDYMDFRKKLTAWKQERLIKKSEKLSEEILDLGYVADDGKANTDVLRIKQKESEFIRSTLGKDEGYASRSEHTGANGKDLFSPSEEEHEKVNNALDAILGS